jgi:hypothetical protein
MFAIDKHSGLFLPTRQRRRVLRVCHQECLHSHLVRVRNDVLQLFEALHLHRVLVGGDRRRRHLLWADQKTVFVSEKKPDEI